MIYSEFHTKEYWLIDPIRKQAEFYRIGTDNSYHYVSMDAEGVFHSEIVKGFWIRVSWLWQEPLPTVLEIYNWRRIWILADF